jgi:hypothetical protein
MVTAEDPFSHMYGGSSEFDVAAFQQPLIGNHLEEEL